jgi:hypothetical protein
VTGLADLLDATSEACRTVDVPEIHRGHVLEAVGRLRIDLDQLAGRLQPRAGVNGTPQPSKPPTPPPPPPPPPSR